MRILPRHSLLGLLVILSITTAVLPQQKAPGFVWPEGRQAAVSLSFDDARVSQLETGLPLFNQLGGKVTFYVVSTRIAAQLDGWKKVLAAGHEIGNHSANHPCSGNFAFSRAKALEDYTLEKMQTELAQSTQQIKDLLNVKTETFAYPCGQTFIGRGRQTRSYVPIVAELFVAGRGWLGEAPNDPLFCDLAQVTGISMDATEFEQIRVTLENARAKGQWVVLAGHDIGQTGPQTTRVSMLQKLLPYLQDPANGYWLAPVGTVAKYIEKQRQAVK